MAPAPLPPATQARPAPAPLPPPLHPLHRAPAASATTTDDVHGPSTESVMIKFSGKIKGQFSVFEVRLGEVLLCQCISFIRWWSANPQVGEAAGGLISICLVKGFPIADVRAGNKC